MLTFAVGSARPPTPEMFTGSIAESEVGRGRDAAVGRDRPALQEQALRVHHVAVVVDRERARARKQHAAAVGELLVVGGDDEEAVAGDRHVGRRARLLERALQRDLLARQRQHAAGVVGGVGVLRVHERAEIDAAALVANGVDVGDVVGNHGERA